MIWYLLYPFRGTTQPPVLSPQHPIRAWSTRYGYHAARHPLIHLLISVAVASILVVPLPFLYTNIFFNGASNLPAHSWTSAGPFDGDINTRPDVVMRSIWVHGDYMKALDKDVLLSALEIQDELLGPTVNFDPRQIHYESQSSIFAPLSPKERDSLHLINGLTDYSWFFHSPLQYWRFSSQKISADRDIRRTVNRRSGELTYVNSTLRHSVVFSGERFENRLLVAADALVITLVHKLDSPVGLQWERQAQKMGLEGSPNWSLYPPDGRSLRSQLYEFRYQPMSLTDNLFLGLAYTLTFVYFCVTLAKVRALKSRVGLMIAVSTQIAVSMASSFTICAILKIDLSKIPRAAYPLIVLAIGLENIFRLISAVIMTPADRPTAFRLSEALGQTTHIALAGVSQNLFVLWLLSKFVYPGVVAFCTFAAIAITFDFFYLLTFFVAVLSIDIRRTELSDSLSKSASSRTHSRPEQRPPSPPLWKSQTWIDLILKGDGPISTRIAGTLVMVSFVLMAQWHFFEDESIYHIARRLSRKGNIHHLTEALATPFSPEINQAQTPTSWLEMQDHETAHEIIQAIKPSAHSFIARVYDPLVFVSTGADRTPTECGVQPFLPAAYDFTKHQLVPFMVIVTFLVCAVALLMHYLLWVESEEEPSDRHKDKPLLSLMALSNGHHLDVVLLAASNTGLVVSVGLDRRICIWDIRDATNSYLVDDPDSNIDPFPVIAMAIDDDSNWLALLSSRNEVCLWNIPERRWGPTLSVSLNGRTPLSFFFSYDPAELIDPVVVVRPSGVMTEMHIEDGQSVDMQLCKSRLVSARPQALSVIDGVQPWPIILTASKHGCVHVVSHKESGWLSDGLHIQSPEGSREISAVVPLPALHSFLAVGKNTVDLIDVLTHKVTHTFDTQPMKPESLRCFHSTRRRPQCGSVGLASLSIAYTNSVTGNCVLQSYLPEREGDTICFRDPERPGSKTCCLWRDTVEQIYTMEEPGSWEAVQAGYIIGVRKRTYPTPSKDTLHITQGNGFKTSGLRRRSSPNSPATYTQPYMQLSSQRQVAQWEIWALSSKGERYSTPIREEGLGQGDVNGIGGLLASNPGPLVKVGRGSIAVGIGNVVHLVTVGNERFDGNDEIGADEVLGAVSYRRKKSAIGKKRS
ncbi:sterol-sensing domain of SREBP cleavage-activation-domain-containing protein, partial [Xylogone sp. PMI_703]